MYRKFLSCIKKPFPISSVRMSNYSLSHLVLFFKMFTICLCMSDKRSISLIGVRRDQGLFGPQVVSEGLGIGRDQ